jgi:phospholipid/cholesterol/gamma-HCH transport system substrate-binding protein
VTRHPSDAWVGALVLLAGLALAFLALQSANLLQTQWGDSTYHIRARFDNVGGLKPKAAVKAAGVVVGRVRSIELNGTSFQAEVVMDLDNRYRFPRDSTYHIRARFDNVGGLKPKAAVKAAGVVVGRVRSIELNGTSFQAEVVMDLDNRYRFPRDSTLRILTSGLLGEQYVGIGAGYDEQFWADGAGVKRTQSAVVLENLIGQFLMNAANREGTPAK